MSYAQPKPIGASRTLAIAIVALTQASLGYAIVTGLAFMPIHKAPDGLKTFNVEEVQPPPELPPEVPTPKPKEVPESPPPVVARPTAVRTNAVPVSSLLEAAPAVTEPTAAPAPPAPNYQSQPPAMDEIPPRSATGDLQRLFRSQDYPIAALERREQGSVSVSMTVGVTGLVTDCDVTSSSGSRTLDDASCRILRGRASFTPARDSRGNLTSDTVRQEIRWVLRSR